MSVPDNAAELKAQVVEAEAKYVLQTYARPPDLVLTHGHGSKVHDLSGKEYLDFSAGIAVNALGHSDDRWYAALSAQAKQLAHTSNLFHTIPQVQLAERLVTTSFADKAFFCNSGTEANESCIKFARKYARLQAGVDPQDPDPDAAPAGLVAFTNSFHGRTMGALALTAKTQYRNPFLPLVGKVEQVGCCTSREDYESVLYLILGFNSDLDAAPAGLIAFTSYAFHGWASAHRLASPPRRSTRTRFCPSSAK
jgi:acetylornithine aminotransferase